MSKFENVQEMIRTAVENKRIQVELKLQIAGQEVELVMRGVDNFNFDKKRVLLEQQLRVDAARNGLVGAELSDAEWQTYLASLDETNRKIFAGQKKPKDRAELYVSKFMGYGLLFTMVPDCLYSRDGAKLLQESQDFSDFEELMRRDPVIVQTLSHAYVALVKMVNETNEQAKNLSAPTDEENGTSGADLPGDTADTGLHSQSD